MESLTEIDLLIRRLEMTFLYSVKKTPSGIISPRANGISAIRKLEDIFGDDWTNQTLNDFFDHLAISEKPGAAKLKQNL